MGAAILSTPEIALEEKEAKSLAEGINAVAKHYPIEASAKAMAWANLAVVGFSIYGSRAIAVYLRSNMEAKRLENGAI